MNERVDLPVVPISEITGEILTRVRAFTAFVGSLENLQDERRRLSEATGLATATIHWYSKRLREMFKLPPRTPLSALRSHPQLQQALEALLVRKVRSDKLSLASARELSVIVPTSGETMSIEPFIQSLYGRENSNAASCYRTLLLLCTNKQITKSVDGKPVPCEKSDLPSLSSITRFLREWRKSEIAVRRSRSRKHDWEALEQPFVTRDVNQFRPGELWIGDHTELDFIVLNEHGKPDRRWISAFIDIRSRLVVGHHLSWQPNSQTIAMAFRKGVLGTQLMAFTGEKFEHLSIANIPQRVMMDNGKDYRSKYTQRVFGKIDFRDTARLAVERITKLHYTQPYHGQSKAQMERWFGSIQTVLKYLPGYKGNQYQHKPDSLKVDLKSGNIPTVEQFDAAIALAVNAYNNRPHRSLKDQSPLQAYLTDQQYQRSIDIRVLDFLMMKVEGRKIRRSQITLFGQEYYSERLLEFNNQSADVYYDPTDLGFVSIYVDGKFAAVACNKEMIGKDERGWMKILHDRKLSEKKLRGEIASFHGGIGDRDARMMLLAGELFNMSAMPAELMDKNAASVSFITGLEGQAKQLHDALESEKKTAEAQESRKKAAKTPLSLAAVNDRIK